MKVTRTYLEAKITEINDWLQNNNSDHPDTKQKLHNRNYYVEKIIEMDENSLEQINI